MAKKQSKFKLEVLKYNTLKLRDKYQIPYKLCYYIMQLTESSSVDEVKYLMLQSQHLLRVKGYYKTFPQVEREVNAMLSKEYLSKVWLTGQEKG